MKVKELVALLESADQDLDVMIESGLGIKPLKSAFELNVAAAPSVGFVDCDENYERYFEWFENSYGSKPFYILNLSHKEQ